MPMITVPDMEWSADGDNTDYSASSSPIVRRSQQNPDPDSLSDEDDFSDEFSVIDSDDEKQRAFSQHHVLQVLIKELSKTYKTHILLDSCRNSDQRCCQENFYQ
jgi:hypothetical protein